MRKVNTIYMYLAGVRIRDVALLDNLDVAEMAKRETYANSYSPYRRPIQTAPPFDQSRTHS